MNSSSVSSQPTSTSQTVRATSPASPNTVQSLVSATGTLLTDHCAAARYTLIDHEPTASYVLFMGCMGSQPECCPFTPATTSTGVYPRPEDAKDAVVKKCPSDYYAIFGSCCPNAFTPWTVALGGATPCYSTLRATTALPSTTREAVIKPRATIPTVTVTNTVFAMQYAVTADEDYVSPGGVAGAIVGGAVLAGHCTTEI
ncbi:hypothetical protein VTI28DRAFT_2990 [Corynascus sepedonium]